VGERGCPVTIEQDVLEDVTLRRTRWCFHITSMTTLAEYEMKLTVGRSFSVSNPRVIVSRWPEPPLARLTCNPRAITPELVLAKQRRSIVVAMTMDREPTILIGSEIEVRMAGPEQIVVVPPSSGFPAASTMRAESVRQCHMAPPSVTRGTNCVLDGQRMDV
jgi:hypothetical protein